MRTFSRISMLSSSDYTMTSCLVERVFSSVNRIKTANRSTMLTTRLMSLCLLTFERQLTVTLDFDEIIDIFKSKPRRLLL